ncbi:MAG: two-CW domain-containing protein [bacterium]
MGFVPKQNCWEYKKCGREKSDAFEGKPGVCPATYIEGLNWVHCGVNGGRCCWAVSGTFCDGKIQGPLQRSYLIAVNATSTRWSWLRRSRT